ncbi:MAG: SDR family oxidoreductase, partial [Alphaproteobacteria bacterium]|nr:SDR family oxidoreductase [Alphaproteobacteria bacterium]
ITDSDQRRALVARSPNDPPFGILVNSAGFARNVPLGEVTEEDYDRVMDVNVKAAYFLAKLIAERLIADQKPGSIITISSQMGLVGGPNRSVYCASKHANEGYTKAMALELGAHQIRVNTVCPTFIKTDLTKHALANEEFRAWVLGNIALGRLGQPEDIAGAITYLASPASRLVTGIALPVDGGWTAK